MTETDEEIAKHYQYLRYLIYNNQWIISNGRYGFENYTDVLINAYEKISQASRFSDFEYLTKKISELEKENQKLKARLSHFEKNQKKISDEQIKQIQELARRKMKNVDIAKIVQCSETTVRRYKKELNI